MAQNERTVSAIQKRAEALGLTVRPFSEGKTYIVDWGNADYPQARVSELELLGLLGDAEENKHQIEEERRSWWKFW